MKWKISSLTQRFLNKLKMTFFVLCDFVVWIFVENSSWYFFVFQSHNNFLFSFHFPPTHHDDIVEQPKDGNYYDDGKLIIVTDSQILSIPLHRCHSEKINSCRWVNISIIMSSLHFIKFNCIRSDCVALQDPYCAWDKIVGKCRSHGAPRWTDETYFYSQVATGQHQACPSGKIGGKATIESQRDLDEFDLRSGRNPGTQSKSSDESGPQITADVMGAQYTVETVVMAVLAAAIFAMLVGFITGYFCGRRCHKDEDDNLPYPDTEYEYFEQRSNINRWVYDL